MDRPESVIVQMAAAAPAETSTQERSIAGLAVPYGPVGNSSLGSITFSQGSLTWAEAGRIKLLRQHDPDVVLGYATRLDDGPGGLDSAFHVPDSPEGDIALAEAADGRRDGLSVGVLLDEDVLTEMVDKWVAGDTTPTAARGRLLEVSQVSLPAFDDARIPSAASAAMTGHVTLAVAFTTPAAPAPDTQKENVMTETLVSAATPAQAEVTGPTASPNPAATASTRVVSEAPVYTFDGRGPSFVRDMFLARFDQDPVALERVNRFNERWVTQDVGQVQAFLRAAVETRTTAPDYIPPGYRPDMFVEVIDKGRPLTSRIGTTSLADATPFKLPVEGEMTGGVGDHTEGTAHVAEGDLALGSLTITPGAISGAFRLSRELIDATNPALDKVAVRAMTRNYQYATEAKVVAALETSDSTATASVNTVVELRDEINKYYDAMFNDPTAVAASPSYYSTLLKDVDSTGRPHLASIGSTNAVGTGKAGGTGADIDGVEIHKAWSVAATMAYLYSADDVFIGESSVQTFRFEEVEGPGVVKLALWSYFAAGVTRPGSVVKVTSA